MVKKVLLALGDAVIAITDQFISEGRTNNVGQGDHGGMV